jgi:ribonuclease VapC
MRQKSKKNFILDAWAVLALIQGEEPAAGKVFEYTQKSERREIALHMSWINLGEVFYSVGRQMGEKEANNTLEELLLLPVRFHEVNRNDILAAAGYKMKFPISYADSFAIALSASLNGTILTGDPEIVILSHVVPVETLKRHPSRG